MAKKWKLELSGISLFHMKTRVCLIYFVNDCRTLLKKTSTNMIYTGYVLGGNKDIKDCYLQSGTKYLEQNGIIQ